MARCNEEWFESLSAWHDGEVSCDDARRIEGHLATCEACRYDAARLAMISEHLRPESASVAGTARVRVLAEATVRRGSSRRGWPLALAAVAVACVVGFAVVFKQHGLPSVVTQEVVMRHLGGFARAQPCDVESSDPKVVSAWLTNHAGYPVSVQVADDMQLLGGRMCRLCGSHTAAIMLRRSGMPLTIFVPPPDSDAARQAEHLADGEVRCTSGPVGSSICATRTPQPMLAVAESGSSQVSAALTASLP